MGGRVHSCYDRRFAKLCDEANLAYHVLDGTGAYSFLNRVELEWLQLSDQQACGRLMTDFLRPAEKARFESLQAHLRRGESLHRVALEINPEGHPRQVLVSATPCFRGRAFAGARYLLDDLSEKIIRFEKKRRGRRAGAHP